MNMVFFHILAIVNNTAMSIDVQVSVFIPVLNSLVIYLGVNMLGLKVILCLTFQELPKCIQFCILKVYVLLYTMEYYLAIKKNEIAPFAATWMQLEMIILSKVNQK